MRLPPPLLPLLLGGAAGGAAGRPAAALQDAVQRVLTAWAASPCPAGNSCEGGRGLQVGWRDATREFSVAAGDWGRAAGHRPVAPGDTFVFGSGTKPYTAAAAVALAEQGALALDDPLALHVDPMLDMIKPGTSLRSLWGNVSRLWTVRDALSMRTCIGDYEGPFDGQLTNSTRVHTPVEFLEVAAARGMACTYGGGGSRYSSASYILAGLAIMRHQPGLTAWTEFDQSYPFNAGVRGADMSHTAFYTNQTLQALLSGPGYNNNCWRRSDCGPPQPIWEQSGSIMGLACGNLVAPTRDVARFIWDLLGPSPRVVSEGGVREMLAPLQTGYGLGLFAGSVLPPAPHSGCGEVTCPADCTCGQGKCYRSGPDDRCAGKPDGYDLGDGGWCWQGRRVEQCKPLNPCGNVTCPAPCNCGQGQCFSPLVPDDRCTGKPDGYNLGDGSWCWQGSRGTYCDKRAARGGAVGPPPYAAPCPWGNRSSLHLPCMYGGYVGHIGGDPGFCALEGFYFGVNASIAIAANYDDAFIFEDMADGIKGDIIDIACNVVQAYIDVVEGGGHSLGCNQPNSTARAARRRAAGRASRY